MNDDTVFLRSSQVVFHRLGESEDGVLLHLDTAAYFSLNPLGVLIWEVLEQPVSLADVVQHVRDAVEDAPPELAADVERFLDELVRRELLERAPGDANGNGRASVDQNPA